MKIETIEVSGFASALKALRLPYNKEEYSEATTSVSNGMGLVGCSSSIKIDGRDIELMRKLIRTGDSHAKPVRGILAYADITAPIDLWVELETYRAGHERLFSASTMNTEGKRLHGKALRKALDEVSFGREIRKIDFFSYQCLRNMVYQRHNHRKLEWHIFLEWVATLPLAKDLILAGLECEWAVHKELYGQYLEED